LIKIAHSPIYTYELPEGHRFPMSKYDLLPQQLLYEGTVVESQFFHPEKMNNDLLELTHTKEYLQKLNRLELSAKEIRAIGFPVTKELIERGKHISNGTLQCAKFAGSNGIAFNIAGGTHHAYADRGEGFCVLNDIALSSNALLYDNIYSKILIVDLDVHQGNGSAKIFELENRVFTFSIHGERNYPLKKELSDLDIGLPDNTGDLMYLNVLRKELPQLIDDVQPEFIFYLAGVDVLASDKLGRLSLTKNGCKERDRFVLEQCKINDIPVAVSMGGGYSNKLADIIDAHANTYRVAHELFF